jgi:repressor LexA
VVERASKKQQELLQYIDEFIKEHGYGPSYREIMNGLGYKSVSTVAVHVNGLLTRGYIRKKDNSARSIEIVTMHHGGKPVEKVLPAQMTWLVEEVETRLAVEQYDEAAVLIAAVELFDTDTAKTLREKLPKAE